MTLVGANSAAAHSSLESTDPAQGGEVATAPAVVRLHFSEGVAIAPDSVHVIDAKGARVDRGRAALAAGDPSTVTIGLQSGLANGTYAVLWHVVSADSHPVSGAFSFGVGVPAGTAPAPAPPDVGVVDLHWALQALWYVGAVLALGIGIFLALLWPAGGALGRTRGLLWSGVGAAAFAAAALYVVQGPYGEGRDLGALTDLGLLRDTFDSTSGPLFLQRLVAVALTVPALGLLPRRTRLRPAPMLVVATVLTLVTALSGHAGQDSAAPIAAAADAVHFLAACVWLGGLVAVVVLVLPTADEDTLRSVLPRWSRTAMIAVGALLATGLYQAWRQVGSLGALTGTDYGRLLMIKGAGLLVLLALAALGLRWVRGLSTREGVASRRVLRGSVLAEVVVGGLVLAVTAALVSTPPARQAYTPAFSARVLARALDASTITVVLDIPVTRPGPQIVHLYTYTDAGKVLDVVQADATLIEKAKKIGPVRCTFVPTGPGHGTSDGLIVPATGDWTLTLVVKTDQTTAYAATVTYSVRSG